MPSVVDVVEIGASVRFDQLVSSVTGRDGRLVGSVVPPSVVCRSPSVVCRQEATGAAETEPNLCPRRRPTAGRTPAERVV